MSQTKDGPLLQEYTAGALAYIDTNYGMMRCKVLSVPYRSEGRILGNADLIVQCLEKTWDLPAGTVISYRAHNVIPRSHRIRRGGQYRINTLFVWTPGSVTDDKGTALIAKHQESITRALQAERKRIYKW